jgi:hypothetical protein
MLKIQNCVLFADTASIASVSARVKILSLLLKHNMMYRHDFRAMLCTVMMADLRSLLSPTNSWWNP